MHAVRTCLQVVILHHMMAKAVIRARPAVLWCYKKELGFSRYAVYSWNAMYAASTCSHRKKRMRQLQKKLKSGSLDVKDDDPFELFIAATDIRYCYYAETHKILGNTYGMCVLQVRGMHGRCAMGTCGRDTMGMFCTTCRILKLSLRTCLLGQWRQ